MPCLHWFRADLRVADNTALTTAAKRAGSVIGCFLIQEEQWQAHAWAPRRVALLMRQLADLRERLAERGVPLVIRRVARFARCPRTLVALARDQGCAAVSVNREYEWNELQRDRQVAAALQRAGIAWWPAEDQCILPPGTCQTKQGSGFRVFTPFRRRWQACLDAEGFTLAPAPKPAPAIRPGADLPLLRRYRCPPPDPAWPGTEAAAQAQLASFAERDLAGYDQLRDRPALERTSRLSASLAIGQLSARQCLAAALAQPASPGRAAWINELVWREFYRDLLVRYPRLSCHCAFQPATEAIAWRSDDAGFAAWCTGRTGIPFVDAGMRQLQATGWMHNRLRMICAMFLSKNLLIDWRRGEAFFMQHLIDGDLANNNGGWQWSASTGCDAVPYFRIFHPITQSRRYDPDGTYLRRWLPELAALDGRRIHDPSTSERVACAYPMPLIELAASRRRALEAFA